MTERAGRRATDALIVAARRTAIGRRGGVLAGTHPHDLLAAAQSAALTDSRIDLGHLDMIVTGCVTQVGDQAYNIGRMAALAAGLPESLPAMTLDAQCGSSQEAVNVAAALVASGAADVVLASGVESMSRVPLGSAQLADFGTPYSPGYLDRYELVNQGESAERIADRWGITRADCDGWALRSQQRAAAATDRGAFRAQIVAVPTDGGAVTSDEGIRASSLDSLGRLRPAFRPDGRHTAGNSSQISDGAAAVVIASRRYVEHAGLEPLAAIMAQAFVGVDPVLKLTGAIDATKAVLARARLAVADLDLIEVSEAFAAVVVAWLAEISPDPQIVNVNGGGIALGHPVGASGARMITTAVHELRDRGAGRALVTMCCGGGLGTATVLAGEA